MSGRLGGMVIGLVFLGGCSLIPGNELRYGPEQQFNDTDVKTQMERQNNVMDLFATAAGYQVGIKEDAVIKIETAVGTKRALTKETGALLVDNDSRWYDVSVAGYNYVDEQCDAYLRQLFIWSREKGRIKDGLVQADKLTGAILTASAVNSSAIQVVAQGFGFGSTMTTILADSYLYTVPLPTLFATEEKMRKAYRDAAAERAAGINSRAAAYQSVRGYLSLCFPQSIEAKMIGAVNAAAATTDESATVKKPAAAKTAKTAKTTTTTTSSMIEVTLGSK